MPPATPTKTLSTDTPSDVSVPAESLAARQGPATKPPVASPAAAAQPFSAANLPQAAAKSVSKRTKHVRAYRGLGQNADNAPFWGVLAECICDDKAVDFIVGDHDAGFSATDDGGENYLIGYSFGGQNCAEIAAANPNITFEAAYLIDPVRRDSVVPGLICIPFVFPPNVKRVVCWNRTVSLNTIPVSSPLESPDQKTRIQLPVTGDHAAACDSGKNPQILEWIVSEIQLGEAMNVPEKYKTL